MTDTTNDPLDPADPPETQPPGTTPQSSEELAEAKAADPPETQPPTNT